MSQPNLESFFGLPEWLMALLFLGAMVIACETGYRLGWRSRIDEKTKVLVPTVTASILALMALLLGFTISMAVSRYDARRLLVVEEANAIGTAYLRMQVIPAPDGPELQELLRRYTHVRVEVSLNARNTPILLQGREEDERLQKEMWRRAASLAQKDPRSVPDGLLLESLNNAFDLENARWVSFVAHVPESVIYVNAVMGLVATLLVGYGFGNAGQRNLLSEGLLILSILIVIAVIVDLDRPHSGVVRISQRALVDLERQLSADH